MQAKELKPGAIVNYEGAPVRIEKVNVQSPSARGAATLYKFRGRDLVSRQKIDFVLKGTDSLPQADFHKREINLMYADIEQVHFLDQTDFNQYSLSREDVAEDLPYVTESLQGMLALIYNGECVGIQLPTAVELKITQCDPAARGNSATGRTKPVTLETGVIVHVPEYLEQGEVIKVDTRTGEYLSRA
jgi:elongation factor P